jgi:hypothetical protein
MAKTRGKTTKQILKTSTSGRKTLQDPKIVEAKNRPVLVPVKGKFPLMEKEVYKVIDWMKEGRSTEWCTQELRNTVNERTKRLYAVRFVENIITTANQLLNLWYKEQIYKVEQVHAVRYNSIVVDKMNKDYTSLLNNENISPFVVNKIIEMDLMDALQALRQKEVLLGLHRKTFKIVFNTQNNFIGGAVTKPKQTKQSLDLDRLTLEEQVELLDLIAISSRSEDEVYGVKLRGVDGKIIDEAVEVEVINDNIKRIEKFVKPNRTIVAPTLIDIKQTIQQRLLEAAAKVPKR